MNVVSEWYQRTFADPQVVLLVLLLVGALLLVNFFGQMLAPAIAAVVIAFLLDGPAGRLREKGLSNPLAVSIVFVTFLALAVVAFFCHPASDHRATGTILSATAKHDGLVAGDCCGVLEIQSPTHRSALMSSI